MIVWDKQKGTMITQLEKSISCFEDTHERPALSWMEIEEEGIGGEAVGIRQEPGEEDVEEAKASKTNR